MAKHLDYYRGPATVTGLMPAKSRSYEIEYVDSRGTVTTFQRNEAIIVPAAIMPKTEDIRDPADIPKPDPQLHDQQNPLPLREGELIICKDDPSSTE